MMAKSKKSRHPTEASHPLLGKKRKKWSVAGPLTFLALVAFLLAAYYLFPNELAKPWPWLLGLVNAALAVACFVCATRQKQEQDDLVRRLRRGQHIDYGKELRSARKRKQQMIDLPILGEVSRRALVAAALFVVVAAWWFTPWAPVTVRAVQVGDLAVGLGEEILAVILVLPDRQLATAQPPILPTRLAELAKKYINEDADPYDLAMKALATGQFPEAREILAEGVETGQIRDKKKAQLARAQLELYAGDFSEAVTQYQKAVEMMPNEPLVRAQLAVAWMHVGKYVEAEKEARRATEQLAAEDPGRALCLHVRAAIRIAYGLLSNVKRLDPTAAGDDAEKAVEAAEQEYRRTELLGEEAQDIWTQAQEKATSGGEEKNRLASYWAASANNQGALDLLRAKYPAARRRLNDALVTMTPALGGEHPRVGAILGNLAVFELTMGRYAKARELNEQAVAIRDNALPEGHPIRAISMNTTAMLDLAVERSEVDALQAAAATLKAFENTFGDDHPNVAAGNSTLATHFARQSCYDPAEIHFRRATDRTAAALREYHPYLAKTQLDLAAVCLEPVRAAETASGNAKVDEAAKLCQDVLSAAEKELDEDHLSVAMACEIAGRCERFRWEAEKSLAEKAQREGRLEEARTHDDQAELYSKNAYQYLKRAEKIREKLFGPWKLTASWKAEDYLHAERIAARADLVALSAPSKAVKDYPHLIRWAEKVLGDKHPMVARLCHDLGILYGRQGKFADARTHLEKALSIDEESLFKDHLDRALTMEALAAALVNLDPANGEAAKKLRSEAQIIRANRAEINRLPEG
ncbi:MAG: tetratricopeptide repeat protein [Planctomycetes bacterium]|nr:tetratricopeptide repeat protein [Planctomycetota bacterium]